MAALVGAYENLREVQRDHAIGYAVRVEVRTRGARAWVRVCGALAFALGYERALRWAEAGAYRLARYRIGSGPWLRFFREPEAR